MESASTSCTQDSRGTVRSGGGCGRAQHSHRRKQIGANLQEAKFVTTNFRKATLEGSFMRYTIFPDADFEGCTGCPPEWGGSPP